MGSITLIVSGNGQAFVSNTSPSDGELVTLDAWPYAGETLDDIYAIDYQGHSIALNPTLNQQQFTYYDAWGNMTIYVTFSGGTPPPHPTYLPPWLIVLLKQKRSKCKY